MKKLGLTILLLILALSPARQGTAVTAATESATPSAIQKLLQNMQNAVLAGDETQYLTYVDQSDPVFALEHRRWADDWAGPNKVASFTLSADHLIEADSSATADLTMTWSTASDPGKVRKAVFAVLFRRSEAGVWQYAGEFWKTLDTDHFHVHAAPGLEQAAQQMIEHLPAIYQYVTGTLDYVPTGAMHIKMYTTSDALVANTLLSLPPIAGWNEPGESLKVLVPKNTVPSSSTLAHEFTHFISFEIAGGKHSHMPWWLEEGIATYVGSHFESQPDRRLNQVRRWAESGALVSWDRISDFNVTPVELWQYVYPQGYAFVRYITERFGVETRNIWLRKMAGDMTIEQATASVFHSSFESLSARFVDWLTNRL